MASYPKGAHMARAAAILRGSDQKAEKRSKPTIDVSIPETFVPLKSDQPDDRPVLDRAGVVIRRRKARGEPVVVLPHTPAVKRNPKPSSGGGGGPSPVLDPTAEKAGAARAKEAEKVRKLAERDRQRAEDAKLRQCRECLRKRPAKAFPDGRGKVCLDCGGQPRGTSVRTVRGGLPGLGRRR
jgi:hypothetical protein